jgi:hypothetical protein
VVCYLNSRNYLFLRPWFKVQEPQLKLKLNMKQNSLH